MKVRCPNCKSILRVPDPPNPWAALKSMFGCSHPENVKVDGKCLACEQERNR